MSAHPAASGSAAAAPAAPAGAGGGVAEERALRFEIEAGEALETIPIYIRHYGRALVYPERDLRGVGTRAVAGEFTAAEALRRMIEGTELELVIAPGRRAWALVRRRPPAAPSPAARGAGEARREPGARDGEPGGEIVGLDALVVTASPVEGYRSANARTATGVGTPVFDTPIPISVVGSRLLDETPGQELRDALNHVPGVLTNPRRESLFVIRGFPGLISYRNGHYRRQLFPDWNVDRVEVIKGPPAIFFGGVRPGGVINLFTVKPVLGERFTDVELEVGSGAHRKAVFFSNIPAGEELALRVGAGALHSERELDMRTKDEDYLGASLVWRPVGRFHLGVDLEAVDRDTREALASARAFGNSRFHGDPAAPASPRAAGVPASAAPTAQEQIREFLTAGGFSDDPSAPDFAPALDSFTPLLSPDREGAFVYSPNAYRDFASRTVDVDALCELAPDLVWETRLNLARDEARGLRPGDGLVPYADGTLRLRFEEFVNLRDSWNINNRLVRGLEWGDTRHTVQLGQEFQRVVFETGGYEDAAGVFRQNAYSEWLYWHPGAEPAPDAAAAMAAGPQSINAHRRRTEDQEGYFTSLQSELPELRLHLLGGVRYNRFGQRGSFETGAAEPAIADHRDGFTRQLGLLFAATDGIHLFGVHSTGLEPNLQYDESGRAAEPIESSGHDLGVKTALLDGRVSGTFTYYALERHHLPRLEDGRFFYDGDTSVAEGLELDLNFSPTDHWQLLLGWHHFIRAEIDSSRTPGNAGQPLAYCPEDTISAWQRLTIPLSARRRLLLGAGFRHADAARISSSPDNVIEAPSFITWDAMLGYAFPLGDHEMLAQLLVRNLSDEPYREGSDAAYGHGRSWTLRLAMRF